jgi:UDP-glucose 4-epimerase
MAELANKNIIVTGGAGFIGSNLVERLCKDNKVLVIDTLMTGSEANLKDAKKSGNVTFKKEDSKNIAKLGFKADIIFHMGMYSASPMYREKPTRVAEVIEGMINVLEYARANGSQIVFASTSSIYNGVTPPHKEGVVPRVTDYYTEGRVGAERMSELYAKLYNVNTAAMRFFSVYGYHEEAKAGYANLVTQFLWAMKKGEQPVVYGDGSQRRDFVFVTDVVEAMIKAVNVKGFDVFNVGTGKNYSLNEMAEKINAVLGTSIKPKRIEMPVSNYVMETLADTTKAEKVLGFKAKVSLDEGIKKLVAQ